MAAFRVELPTGSITSLGLTVAGSPPCVASVNSNGPLGSKAVAAGIEPGMYVQTLLVKDAEYSYMTDTESLLEALEYFANVPRTLVFRHSPLQGPPMAQLTLPTGKLDLVLKGFPPTIMSVEKTSPLYGKLPVGYVVDRLTIGDKEYSLASGGFSDVNVRRWIYESSHVEGRVIVVKKVKPLGDTRSSSRPFDDWESWNPFRRIGDSKKSATRKRSFTS